MMDYFIPVNLKVKYNPDLYTIKGKRDNPSSIAYLKRVALNNILFEFVDAFKKLDFKFIKFETKSSSGKVEFTVPMNDGSLVPVCVCLTVHATKDIHESDYLVTAKTRTKRFIKDKYLVNKIKKAFEDFKSGSIDLESACGMKNLASWLMN